MLEGGEYCFDSYSCTDRLRRLPDRISSVRASTLPLDGKGLLSAISEENPYWKDANKVYLHYCSSDLWLGTRKANESQVLVEGINFSFGGGRNLESSLRYLETLGLDAASEILLGGISAGAVGFFATLPGLAAQVRNTAPTAAVSFLIDSGWLADVSRFKPEGDCTVATNCSLRSLAPTLVSTWQALPSLGPDCVSMYGQENIWKCFYGRFLWPLLPTTVADSSFLVELLYDPINLGENGLSQYPSDKLEIEYAAYMAKSIEEELSVSRAYFAPACYRKAGIVNSDGWASTEINGISLAESHQQWYTTMKLHQTNSETLADQCVNNILSMLSLGTRLSSDDAVPSSTQAILDRLLDGLFCNPTCPFCLCKRKDADSAEFNDALAGLLYAP